MKTDSPKIEEIQSRYKRSLIEKAESFEQQLSSIIEAQEAQGTQIEPKKIEKIIKDTHDMLHKLAGSAGMYGYTEISDDSRTAMGACNLSDVEDLKVRLKRICDLLRKSAQS